jgi:hypothetical protein
MCTTIDEKKGSSCISSQSAAVSFLLMCGVYLACLSVI